MTFFSHGNWIVSLQYHLANINLAWITVFIAHIMVDSRSIMLFVEQTDYCATQPAAVKMENSWKMIETMLWYLNWRCLNSAQLFSLLQAQQRGIRFMVENAHQYCAMFELQNENECLWRELINVRFQICGRITKEFILRGKKLMLVLCIVFIFSYLNPFA